MFDGTSFILRCTYKGEFSTIKKVISDFFMGKYDSVLSNVADNEVCITTSYFPKIYCKSNAEGTTDLLIKDFAGYDSIGVVSSLLSTLDSKIREVNKSITIEEMYASYNFEQLTLEDVIKMIKLSYVWQEYNFALVDEDINNSCFCLLNKSFVEKLRCGRDCTTMDNLRLQWLLNTDNQVVDLGPVLFGDEAQIYVYLGKNIEMLDTMLRYYYCFFKFAQEKTAYIPADDPIDKLKSFRAKITSIMDKTDDSKRFRKTLYNKLRLAIATPVYS